MVNLGDSYRKWLLIYEKYEKYEKETRLINSLLDGQEMTEGQPSLKVSVAWV